MRVFGFNLQRFTSPDVPVLNIIDDRQPLLPTNNELTVFQAISERVTRANNTIIIYKDQARLDRAVNSHSRLVNLVANRISAAGGVPKSNQLVDLAVTMGQDFIFEMKSTDGENVRSQVRKGISQLQEYRYLQNKEEAKLVLVIQNELDRESEWMHDYLENDRGICLVWDGDNLLHCVRKNNTRTSLLKFNSITKDIFSWFCTHANGRMYVYKTIECSTLPLSSAHRSQQIYALHAMRLYAAKVMISTIKWQDLIGISLDTRNIKF